MNRITTFILFSWCLPCCLPATSMDAGGTPDGGIPDAGVADGGAADAGCVPVLAEEQAVCAVPARDGGWLPEGMEACVEPLDLDPSAERVPAIETLSDGGPVVDVQTSAHVVMAQPGRLDLESTDGTTWSIRYSLPDGALTSRLPAAGTAVSVSEHAYVAEPIVADDAPPCFVTQVHDDTGLVLETRERRLFCGEESVFHDPHGGERCYHPAATPVECCASTWRYDVRVHDDEASVLGYGEWTSAHLLGAPYLVWARSGDYACGPDTADCGGASGDGLVVALEP